MHSDSSRPNLKEWFQLPLIQVQQSSINLGWNAVNLQIAHLSPALETQLGPITEDATINILLHGRTKVKTKLKNIDIAQAGAVYVPGMINLVPRKFETDGSWDSHVTVGFWTLSHRVMQDLCAEVFDGDPAQVELYPRFRFQDPLIHQLGSVLVKELEQQNPFGAIYADSIAHTMMLHLLRNYSSASKIKLQATGKLSHEQERMIAEYIEAQLEYKISLSDLAALFPMSVPHLERLFVASFGMPVYKYVISRRMERAKILLYDKKMSLYEVALECGFASQSHFNHQFKSNVGISPRQFVRLIP